ncbi:Plastid-lipid associated protein PAP / fibrillin family protein [Perilla frutescens var. hirtella]|uniref:Plastid-lipid associated protein PAP / fibrillin family protein n=1 Tax=Perilla frutescens var. hirtella TaxID=608512 RepID=A0AAD4J5C9_PERFH|nr:Plastid-lipid associated protein PAP / fibrillin family protein [Perilla frutescens var. frutescens]KAH6827510.1 Plastid-lipid associated protein PAP / fibrillin family protein [Perilla frutescens var. hirtella]
MHSRRTPSCPPSAAVFFLENPARNGKFCEFPRAKRKPSRKCRAMVQQTVQGPSASYAREMERLSAKESLLLAFKDAGGFEALVTGKTTSTQKIDVNERIVALERLNPTSRPTTSPFLEGQWNFEWFGSGSPGLLAARILFERFPPALASLSKLDVVIKDGYADISASVKLLNSIESRFTLSTRLSIEGPLRMKEEYVEGIFESPKVNEESLPEQLKGALVQATNTMQQLPVSIRDALASGFKIPLGGTFDRLFLISYLDEEILIIRDTAGVPEVLTRLDPGPLPPVEPIVEYES